MLDASMSCDGHRCAFRNASPTRNFSGRTSRDRRRRFSDEVPAAIAALRARARMPVVPAPFEAPISRMSPAADPGAVTAHARTLDGGELIVKLPLDAATLLRIFYFGEEFRRHRRGQRGAPRLLAGEDRLRVRPRQGTWRCAARLLRDRPARGGQEENGSKASENHLPMSITLEGTVRIGRANVYEFRALPKP